MILEDYQSAREGAVYFPVTQPGYLRISGPDRLSFIQRQTTNDVRLLNSEHVQKSVLTSPTGRILDVLYLIQEPEALGCITQPARGAETARFLKSRIFFMDKVNLIDASQEYAQIDVEGPYARSILASTGITLPEGLHMIRQVETARQTLRIFSKPGLVGTGFRIMVPAAGWEFLKETLESAGASLLSRESYQILRVEAGLPGAEHEFNEDFSPLEVNLKDTISGDKGCYTGQEVLARQINYDKITRSLMGVKLPELIQPGTQLKAEGKPAGTITTTVESPRLGPIALAVIKRPFDQPGKILQVQLEDAQIEGQICELPF